MERCEALLEEQDEANYLAKKQCLICQERTNHVWQHCPEIGHQIFRRSVAMHLMHVRACHGTDRSRLAAQVRAYLANCAETHEKEQLFMRRRAARPGVNPLKRPRRPRLQSELVQPDIMLRVRMQISPDFQLGATRESTMLSISL